MLSVYLLVSEHMTPIKCFCSLIKLFMCNKSFSLHVTSVKRADVGKHLQTACCLKIESAIHRFLAKIPTRPSALLLTNQIIGVVDKECGMRSHKFYELTQ